MVGGFKLVNVTSLLTAESKSLYFGDAITERGFSPVADNLLILRYVVTGGGRLSPAIRILKTRGSVHDRGTHGLSLAQGGIRITGDQLGGGAPTARSKRGSSVRKPRSKERLR